MFIDAHSHGWQSDKNSAGRRIPPLRPMWIPGILTPEQYVERIATLGIERIVLLDPPEITLPMFQTFGNFVIPVPQVDIDAASPDDVHRLFDRGAVGIKFIAPAKSYGSDDYFPLYEAVRDRMGLAVFHTGFLALQSYEPGGMRGRKIFTDITNMRPAALDRLGRAFPDLKILMSHFGNPWWEEALVIVENHANIYTDLSGGTAFRRPMRMWTDIFAPNGVLDEKVLGKLCFGVDGTHFELDDRNDCYLKRMIDFHLRLMDCLNAPEELREKVYRTNILKLTSPGKR